MSETRGFAELLPYMTLITDGVVVCKDSGLLATFEIQGKDLDSISDAEISVLLGHIETAFYPLRIAPWKVWFTLKRFQTDAYPGGFEDAPDAPMIAHMLDQNHKEYFSMQASYATKAYVSFYLASGVSNSSNSFMDRITMFIKRTGMMLSDGGGILSSVWTGLRAAFSSRYAFAYKAHELQSAIEEFEKTISGCTSILQGLGLTRLKGPEFLGFLRSMSSGYANPDQPVKINEDWDWFLDSLLPDSRMDVGTDTIRLGDNLVSALSIKEWPGNTDPDLIQALMQVNTELTFSSSFGFMSNDEAKGFISGVKSYAEITKHKLVTYFAGAISGNQPGDDKANRNSLDIIEDATEAERAVDAGEYAFGLMNLTMLVQQRIEENSEEGLRQAQAMLENNTDSVRKTLSTIYPGIIREELHLLGAWSATLPGQWYEPVRWSFMHTGNLADSAPVLLLSEGERENKYLTEQTGRKQSALTVLPTPYNTPFYFNFHHGALGHTFVVGPSRSGKSVFMNFLISQWFKYSPCRVIIFDKDYSCRINTLMHDGEYFDLKEGAGIKLNPILLVNDRQNWSFLVGWISDLISYRGHVITSEDEKAIRNALENVASLEDDSEKRLFSIYINLPEALRIHLDAYVDNGQLAHYFDNKEDKFALSTITAFEMGDIMQNKQVASAFVDYAFYRIMKTIRENIKPGQPVIPTMIYLEECWFLFEDERFREKVRDWLKTLAKLTAHVVMATQSLEDMVSSDDKFFASLRDNIPTKIFLPNPAAGNEKLKHLYMSEFGLPEKYVQLIQQGIQKRDYLIVTPEYAKQVVCQFGASSLAPLRSDANALSAFDTFYKKTPDWKKRYIYNIIGEELPNS